MRGCPPPNVHKPFFAKKEVKKIVGTTIYQTARFAWKYRRELYGATAGVATAIGNSIANIISDMRPDKMDSDRREKTLGRRLGRHLGGSVIIGPEIPVISSYKGKALRAVRPKYYRRYRNKRNACCC